MNKSRLKLTFLLLFIVGTGLRVMEYSTNRSLWLDEANIAFKLTSIPFIKSIRPPAPDAEFKRMQPMPLGFIFAEKLFISLFGPNEYSLRLYPLICGILSLFLFYYVVHRILGPPWSLCAFALFAVSRNLIYYASEVKPYSSDVLFALLLIIVFLKIIDRKLDNKTTALWALLGAVMVWNSFPATIILASTGTCLIVHHLVAKDHTKAKKLIVIAGAWSLSIAAYYLFSLRYYYGHRVLMEFWAPSFMPAQGGLWAVFQWVIGLFKTVLRNDLQYPVSLGGLTLLVGIYSLLDKNKKTLYILAAPVLGTLFLAALGKYPFYGRVITFLLPSFILLCMIGAEKLVEHMAAHYRTVTGVLLALFFLHFATIYTVIQAQAETGPDEIKPVFQYLESRARPGDEIVIYYSTLAAYRYYYKRFHLRDDPSILSRGEINECIDHAKNCFEQFRGGKRVWIIFTRVSFHKGVNKRIALLEDLDRMGKRLDALEVPLTPRSTILEHENGLSASLYLYDLQ